MFCPTSPDLLVQPCNSCHTSSVSHLLFHISCLIYPVSHLLSPISCLKSPVSHIMSPVQRWTRVFLWTFEFPWTFAFPWNFEFLRARVPRFFLRVPRYRVPLQHFFHFPLCSCIPMHLQPTHKVISGSQLSFQLWYNGGRGGSELRFLN